MVQFRPQAREIIAKIVYYGPPLGGKTTNLRTLYQGYPPDTRGELVVVPAGGDRTIFFDFLPVDAGTLRGMKLRVQLYTVPGQVQYNATRQVVLRGADAIVFVADSQRNMLRSNRESWENLKDNLLLQGIALADIPHVLQYNKRDLPDALTVEELDDTLNEYNTPFFEAVATIGIGLEETLQGVVKLVARSLRDRFKVPLEAAGEPLDVAAPSLSLVSAPAPEHGARIFSFAPPPIDLPAALPDLGGEVFFAEAAQSPPKTSRPDEVTHKVVVSPVPRLHVPELPPLADPFAAFAAEPEPFGDDVFALPRPAPPPEPEPSLDLEFESQPSPGVAATVEIAELATPELEMPEVNIPAAGFQAAIQRVVPRALAQIGDVRELELEVPVPSAWTGGRRLTLQLRLTLVPEEDAHAG